MKKNSHFYLFIFLAILGLIFSLQNQEKIKTPIVFEDSGIKDRVIEMLLKTSFSEAKGQEGGSPLGFSSYSFSEHKNMVDDEVLIQTSINQSGIKTIPFSNYTSDAEQSVDQNTPDFSIVNGKTIPPLDEFATEVRGKGMGGLWADGLFAFRFYTADWGIVPNSSNTASYATRDAYHAFFIHDFLGGRLLYEVTAGTLVALIRANSIEWYKIEDVYRFAGTSTGNGCEYTAPFYDWDGGNSYSANQLLNTYYVAPLTIQTCICTGDKNGILILSGS